MNRPTIIDFFSKAGGASMGYHRAGFRVIGVDIQPQPRYPFEFVQGDVFAMFWDLIDRYRPVAITGSPECRGHTPLQSVAGAGTTGWQLAKFIQLCEDYGRPYVAENVMAAQFPTDYPANLVLCADRNFGLRTVRHRKFRCTGFECPQPPHPKGHSAPTSTKRRKHDWDRGMHVSITGDVGVYVGSEAMGIDWMTGNELSQAIPPAYTQYIGEYLMKGIDHGTQAHRD